MSTIQARFPNLGQTSAAKSITGKVKRSEPRERLLQILYR